MGLLAAVLLSLAPAAAAVTPLPADWVRGAQIVGYERDTFSGSFVDKTDSALAQLHADGGNTAVFVTDCFMATFQSTSMDCTQRRRSPTQSLAAGMDYARSLGLQVGLNPHVDSNGSFGRGEIQPTSWDTWWDNGHDD